MGRPHHRGDRSYLLALLIFGMIILLAALGDATVHRQ